MFSTTVGGATRRLVATGGQGRDASRAGPRHAQGGLRDARHDARERRYSGVVLAAQSLPRRPRRQPVERSRVQSRHQPALRAGRGLVRDVLGVRAGPVHSGQALHGRQDRSRSAREGARLAHRGRRVDRRREMEVPVAASDGGGGHHDGRQPGAHRRADRRLRRVRRAERRRAVPLQHRRADRRRCRHLCGGRPAVHRRGVGKPVELLDREKSRRADDRRLRAAARRR